MIERKERLRQIQEHLDGLVPEWQTGLLYADIRDLLQIVEDLTKERDAAISDKAASYRTPGDIVDLTGGTFDPESSKLIAAPLLNPAMEDGLRGPRFGDAFFWYAHHSQAFIMLDENDTLSERHWRFLGLTRIKGQKYVILDRYKREHR